ncbi:MAG: lytic transglycosylase domain-containing protein [Vicinamibacterales bacterium]
MRFPTPARVPRTVALVAAAWACVVSGALPASAELVTFSTGRTMSIREHRVDGPSIVFTLRGGGEMVLDSALVSSIGPDEVPYPEPLADGPRPDPAAVPPPSAALAVHATFDPIITRLSAEKGVDAAIVRAVIQVESGYQPRARSRKGAVGLMQVMPATGRRYGITNLYDPSANIRAGVTHLKMLLDRFPLNLALAAYNAGEGTVERFAGMPPYPETLDYVARIRALLGR